MRLTCLPQFSGPEYSIKQIFGKARQFAPCYLVFEDLDTIVTDSVRSYFLNEVDGLAANDGILIIGSTNHLDRLDPGIAKRPARFDRKYLFPDPGRKERVMYAQFWQGKLKSNKAIAFPDELCGKMADITDGFSFAYLQEAFVATLMAIASSQADEQNVWTEVRSCDTSSVQKAGCPDGTPTSDDITDGIRRLMKTRFGLNPRSQCAAPETQGDSDWFHVEDDEAEFGDGGDGNDLDDLVFWVEFQKQVAILREGMERDA